MPSSEIDSGLRARRTVTIADGVSDGVTELHVNPVTGELSISDAGGANRVWLQYDPQLFSEIVAGVRDVREGDLNADATSVLDPWENSGGYAERTAISEEDSIPSPLIRRRGSRIETKLDPVAAALLSGEWSPDCPSIAAAIGAHRASYASTRSNLFQSIRGIQGIPAMRLVWREGRPYITLQDVRNLYISSGMTWAETKASSIALGVMRLHYNGNFCQLPIVVQPPSLGSVYVPNSGGGGGFSLGCISNKETWEISFDGGATWIDIPVVVTTCGEQQE